MPRTTPTRECATRSRPLVLPRLGWGYELLLVVAADLLYELLRAIAPARRSLALSNARLIEDDEPAPVEQLERWLNRAANHHAWVAHSAAFYYLMLHLAVTGGVLLWLWWRRPQVYARARTTLFVVSLGALLFFWVFPVAPPRLAVPGTIDTISHLSVTTSSAGTSAEGFVNDYAAFPSLHVAWAVWCAWAIRTSVRRRRAVAWLYPLATALVVVATGNHYVIDVMAGAVGVAVAVFLTRPQPSVIAHPGGVVDLTDAANQPAVPG